MYHAHMLSVEKVVLVKQQTAEGQTADRATHKYLPAEFRPPHSLCEEFSNKYEIRVKDKLLQTNQSLFLRSALVAYVCLNDPIIPH